MDCCCNSIFNALLQDIDLVATNVQVQVPIKLLLPATEAVNCPVRGILCLCFLCFIADKHCSAFPAGQQPERSGPARSGASRAERTRPLSQFTEGVRLNTIV